MSTGMTMEWDFCFLDGYVYTSLWKLTDWHFSFSFHETHFRTCTDSLFALSDIHILRPGPNYFILLKNCFFPCPYMSDDNFPPTFRWIQLEEKGIKQNRQKIVAYKEPGPGFVGCVMLLLPPAIFTLPCFLWNATATSMAFTKRKNDHVDCDYRVSYSILSCTRLLVLLCVIFHFIWLSSNVINTSHIGN